MHQRNGRYQLRIQQIQEVSADLIGQQHALVNHGARRERWQVELLAVVELEFAYVVFGALTHHEQLTFKGVLIFQRFRTTDKDLTGHRLQITGGLRQDRGIHWHIAPAEEFKAFFMNNAGQHRFTGLTTGNRLRQEDIPHGIVTHGRQTQTLLGAFGAQEGIRQLDQYPGAIAEHGVITCSATVLEVFQDQQTLLDNLVTLLILNVRDKADAAGIVLVGRVI